MASQLVDEKGRFLNHAELVYRPGERKLVSRVFEALGCVAIETGGPYLVIQIDPGQGDFLNNVLYASEVSAEQWTFETLLQKQIGSSGELAAAYGAYEALRTAQPQRTTHFGIRMASAAELEQTLERIASLKDPELDGRLQLSGVFRPGDPGALSDALIQAFVRTDVCASGLISLGQHIELQAQLSSPARD